MSRQIAPRKWEDFVQEILGMASVFAELRGDSFDLTPPKKIATDLQKIDKSLTTALQKLLALQLEHREGQNIITQPFNWPVVQALDYARLISHTSEKHLITEIRHYPSALIKELRELRDLARLALKLEKPNRGNSPGRDQSAARKSRLAKNFVFRFRSRFGFMPPITKTGRVIELLKEMFEAAGETSVQIDYHLRKAIENDTTGRKLLPPAKNSKRVK